MRTFFPILLTVFLAMAALPASAQESLYTDLDLGACAVLEVFEEGGGSSLRCEGLPDHPVFVTEGDLRADVDFGVANASFDTFAAFNQTGAKIEWRMRGKTPFAAILRYRLDVSGPDGMPVPGEVLQVSKVGRPGVPGCPVAYVDAKANKNANVLARQAADERVPGFDCAADKPRYVGATGPLSGSASGTGE